MIANIKGFASGNLDENATSVRLFVNHGMEIFVAQSYSKNLGLYAERIGAINAVCSSSDTANRVKSQLKRLARPMYSNPLVHGAQIVPNVVGDSVMFDELKSEMELMARRIKGVRQQLYDYLSTKDKSGKDWSFVLKQIGMFSFKGLNKTQSENMTNKWHVYMTKDGHSSSTGLYSIKAAKLPLLIRCDVRLMSPGTEGQLGVQGKKVSKYNDLEVWAGPLSNNHVAVILWNRSESRAMIIAKWKKIGLQPEKEVKVKNL